MQGEKNNYLKHWLYTAVSRVKLWQLTNSPFSLVLIYAWLNSCHHLYADNRVRSHIGHGTG